MKPYETWEKKSISTGLYVREFRAPSNSRTNGAPSRLLMDTHRDLSTNEDLNGHGRYGRYFTETNLI